MSAIFDKVKENKEFNKLCKMSQNSLKSYLIKTLNMENGDGYAFYQGTFPVLLTAHMDTVHMRLPGTILYKKDKNGNRVVSSPNGIGGDDRCGVYMILQILKKLDCSVLFCEDEEIGSIGASKFVKTDLCKRLKDEKKFKYIIELDRKNANDAVFYNDDNKDFHDFVTEEFWEKSWGTWSDICELSPALGISSVNLSCGYYEQHTKSEYVVLEEMEKAIEETIKLLSRTDLNAEPFEFKKKIYSYYDCDDDDWWTSYRSKDNVGVTSYTVFLEVLVANPTLFGSDYLISQGMTRNECWKNIFFENPELCVSDIVDWYFY